MGGLEPVAIQDFVAQGAVETLFISVLPRRAWINMYGFDANPLEPRTKQLRYKLWLVVRVDKFRFSIFIIHR